MGCNKPYKCIQLCLSDCMLNVSLVALLNYHILCSSSYCMFLLKTVYYICNLCVCYLILYRPNCYENKDKKLHVLDKQRVITVHLKIILSNLI